MRTPNYIQAHSSLPESTMGINLQDAWQSLLSGKSAGKISKGKEAAAWFLKSRSYVDDVTGDTHDKETALPIPRNIENIIEK